MCGRAVAGADAMYTPDGRLVCPGCFAKMGAADAPPPSPAWRGFAIGGAIVGAIPLFVHYSTSSSSSVNGKITSFVYRDYIAVGAGAVAVLLAIVTIVSARKEQLRRALAFAAGFGVLALGGYQIANGLGAFAEPGTADVTENTSFDTVQMKTAVPPPPAPVIDPKDPTKCADAAACLELGLSLSKDQDPRATAALQRACDLGSDGGCLHYARVVKDADQAKALFDKSCTAGYMPACADLAHLVEAADRKRALELFEKVCDHDDSPDFAAECSAAGTALHDPKASKAQAKLAAGYLAKACTRSDKYCYGIAAANELGWGVAKDLKKARELYGKACTAAQPDACNSLGAMQEQGKGGKKDRAGAKLSYKAACEGKLPAGCKNQKRLK